MQIEDIIKANTAALLENTAALREILSVGASTAAVQAVPEKAKRTKPTPAQAEAREKIQEVLDQDPPITKEGIEQEPEAPAPETPSVPNLPPTELRAKLKEDIKLRIMGDPAFKNHFEATREKYGIALVKDLTDDQLPCFYTEMLA